MPRSIAASPISIFDFDTVLLGLAMVTIGGIGRAEGAVLGTLIVIFLDDVLIELGPLRAILIGGLMLRGRAVPQQRLFRHPQAVPRLARQEEGRMALDPGREGRRDAARRSHRDRRQGRPLLPPLRQDAARLPEDADRAGDHRRAPSASRWASTARRSSACSSISAAQPQDDKYAIIGGRAVQGLPDHRAFGAARRRPAPGRGPIYPNLEEAYHGVFMRRVHDLLES